MIWWHSSSQDSFGSAFWLLQILSPFIKGQFANSLCLLAVLGLCRFFSYSLKNPPYKLPLASHSTVFSFSSYYLTIFQILWPEINYWLRRRTPVFCDRFGSKQAINNSRWVTPVCFSCVLILCSLPDILSVPCPLPADLGSVWCQVAVVHGAFYQEKIWRNAFWFSGWTIHLETRNEENLSSAPSLCPSGKSIYTVIVFEGGFMIYF